MILSYISKLFLLTFICGCSATTRCLQGLPHTKVMKHHDGKCYQFVSEEHKWESARDFCWRHGGWLVTVNSEDVHRFIVHSLNHIEEWKNKGVWIGLNDISTNSYWKWVTSDPNRDDPMTWSNWRDRSFLDRGGSCVRMVRDHHWKWSQTPCNDMFYTYRFICQYNELPTTVLLTTTTATITTTTTTAMTPPYVANDDNVVSTSSTPEAEVIEELEPTTRKMNALKGAIMRDEKTEPTTTTIQNSIAGAEMLLHPVMAAETESWHQNKFLLFVLMLCALGLISATVVCAIFLVRRRQKKQLTVSTIEGLANNTRPIWNGDAKTAKRYVRNLPKSSPKTIFSALPTKDCNRDVVKALGNEYVVNDIKGAGGRQKKSRGNEENEYLQPKECSDWKCTGQCGMIHNQVYAGCPDDEDEVHDHIYESIDEYEKRHSIVVGEETPTV